MLLLRGPIEPADPTMEMAVAHAVLREASRGEIGPTLRVYRPAVSTVAFGRRDTRRPGFVDAVRACRDAGFTPVVRAPGGSAVGYTRAALVVDHVSPGPRLPIDLDVRFREFGTLYAEVLRGLGVDARVGEVPGEYCPGAFSVNARGKVKLVGTAQRVVKNAWLFSAVAIIEDVPLLRHVLGEVYRQLDLPFDPDSVGAVREESPMVAHEAVERAVIEAYAGSAPLEQAVLDTQIIDLARTLAEQHVVNPGTTAAS